MKISLRSISILKSSAYVFLNVFGRFLYNLEMFNLPKETFVYGVSSRSRFTFLSVTSLFPASFIEEAYLAPFYAPSMLFMHSLCTVCYCVIKIRGLSLIDFIVLASTFILISYNFYYYSSIIQFKIGKCHILYFGIVFVLLFWQMWYLLKFLLAVIR